jgi:hypothetical protein
VAKGREQAASGSLDGDKPGYGAEKTESDTEQADAFGGGSGFEPEIAGDTEADDKQNGEGKREQAQGEQKMGGSAGGPCIREADGEFRRSKD